MLRFLIALAALSPLAASAAEWVFDFSKFAAGQTPPGFRSAVSGEGQPGEWKIVLDDYESAFPAITSKGSSTSKKHVLAQLSADTTDEHFPMLIFEEEKFGDFTLTTRFKTVSGRVEQMAGIAFRLQDEKNYYYVRASSKGNTFRFFKLVNGQRSAPIGPEVEIPSGVWHEMSIDCRGNSIRCRLNGKEVIPALTDTSFTSGKIAFWTKSDSVSYFADTRLTYTPLERLAQAVIREMMAKYPRILGIDIFAHETDGAVKVIASTDKDALGKVGETTEHNVIANSSVYFGKQTKEALITMPLHDRNGDTVAAVRLTLESFKGQTEQNAIARATPIIKEIEMRMRSAKTILE